MPRAIVQTPEEQQLVLAEAIKLRAQDPKLPRLQALRHGNSVLPPNRRVTSYPSLDKLPWAVFPEDSPPLLRHDIEARANSKLPDLSKTVTLNLGDHNGLPEHKRSKPSPEHSERLVSNVAAARQKLAEKRAKGEIKMIRWKDSEIDQVMREAAMAVFLGQYDLKRGFEGLMMKAQDVLPIERRRNGFPHLAHFKETYAVKYAEIQAADERQKAAEARELRKQERAAAKAAEAAEQERQAEAALQAQRKREADERAQELFAQQAEQQRIAQVSLDLADVETGTVTVTQDDAAALQRAEDTPTTTAAIHAFGHAGLREAAVDFLAGVMIDALKKVVAEAPSIFRSLIPPQTAQSLSMSPAMVGETAITTTPVPQEHLDDDRIPLYVSHESGIVPPKDKARLTSVLVVGAKAQQKEIIRQRVGHKLDLKFVDSEESMARVKDACTGPDVVVTWANFTSLEKRQAVEKRAQRHINVLGGMGNLCERLEWIAGQPLGRVSQLNLPPAAGEMNGVNGAGHAAHH